MFIVTGLGPGRPQKTFSELSESSKRRKTKDLRSSDLKELAYATQMKLRKTGETEASKIVKVLTKSPRRAKKYAAAMKKIITEEDKEVGTKLGHLRALFMYTEARLTQAQYEIVRETNPGFYPCYSILQKLKKECYPEIHRITETCAEVRVQSLMDHTTKRLLIHLGEEVLEQLTVAEKQSLVLISKWGCDGSQQMQYKMKFENETDSDANIFQSSVVPLQLVYGTDKKIVWQNPAPSSPRHCRPIRLRFNNPNAVQFRAAYKKLLIRAEMRYKGFGNCVPLQQINILTCSGKNPSKPIKRLTEKQSFVEVPEDHSDFRLRPREKVGLLQIYAKC